MSEWYWHFEKGEKIVCPYCGKEYEPSYKETYIGGKDVDCYKEGDQGEFICDGCGRKFTLLVENKWEYETETIDGEMSEDELEAWDE